MTSVRATLRIAAAALVLGASTPLHAFTMAEQSAAMGAHHAAASGSSGTAAETLRDVKKKLSRSRGGSGGWGSGSGRGNRGSWASGGSKGGGWQYGSEAKHR